MISALCILYSAPFLHTASKAPCRSAKTAMPYLLLATPSQVFSIKGSRACEAFFFFFCDMHLGFSLWKKIFSLKMFVAFFNIILSMILPNISDRDIVPKELDDKILYQVFLGKFDFLFSRVLTSTHKNNLPTWGGQGIEITAHLHFLQALQLYIRAYIILWLALCALCWRKSQKI